MNINNGSTPASPIDITDDFYPGLTKREKFAGMAMQGILANADSPAMSGPEIARGSVSTADLLLTELDKQAGIDQSTLIRLMAFVKTVAALSNGGDHNMTTINSLALDILRDAE